MISHKEKYTFLLIIFFISTINCQIIDWWNTYNDRNVKITFPCSYSKQEDNYGTKNGYYLSMIKITCEEDDMFYMLTKTTAPNPYGKSVRSMLQSAIDGGSTYANNVTTLTQKEITLNGHFGFEYETKLKAENNEYYYSLSRIFYVNAEVYSAKILYKKNNYDKNSVNEFLSSFKIK